MLKKRFTRPVTITLEEAVFARILEITDRKEVSLSEWIRHAITDLLGKEQERTAENEV